MQVGYLYNSARSSFISWMACWYVSNSAAIGGETCTCTIRRTCLGMGDENLQQCIQNWRRCVFGAQAWRKGHGRNVGLGRLYKLDGDMGECRGSDAVGKDPRDAGCSTRHLGADVMEHWQTTRNKHQRGAYHIGRIVCMYCICCICCICCIWQFVAAAVEFAQGSHKFSQVSSCTPPVTGTLTLC